MTNNQNDDKFTQNSIEKNNFCYLPKVQNRLSISVCTV